MPFTRLKIVVFAPMPSASVSTTTEVKPGFFSNWRKANFKSFMVCCQLSVAGCSLLVVRWSAVQILRPLRDATRHHSINAHQRQRQGNGRKAAQQPGVEA